MPRKPSVWLLMPSVILSMISMSLLLPVLPGLKTSWYAVNCTATTTNPHQDCEEDYKRAQQMSGIFTSMRFFVIFIVSPYLGQLSDRIGRRPLLRLNNIANMLPVAGLWISKGESPTAYFVPFVASGLLASGQFQMVAYVVDCSEPGDRTRYFGYLGAVQGVALTLSELFAAFANSVDNMDLFVISFVLMLLNGLWIDLVLPESLVARQDDESPPVASSQKPVGWSLLTKNTYVAWLALFTFLTTLPEQGVVEIVIIYMVDMLRLNQDQVRHFSALYLCFSGLGLIVAQTLFIYVFTKLLKFGPIGLLVVSNVANVLHMFIYASIALNHSETVAFLNILVTSLMFLGLPAGNALLSKRTKESEQGLAMGTLDSIRSLVGAFGPVLLSYLYFYFGDKYNAPQAPFLFGSIFASLALVVVLGPLRWGEVTTPIVEPLLRSDMVT